MTHNRDNVSDAVALVALLDRPGVGYVTANEALSAAARSDTPLAELLTLEPAEIAERFPEVRQPGRIALGGAADSAFAEARKITERLARTGAQTVIRSDSDYPAVLARSSARQAPPILYVAGDVALLSEPAAAVAGARRASPEGLALAAECARIWVEMGVVVVSGAAPGTDTVAHREALKSGGRTVYVLAEGLLSFRTSREVLAAVDAGRAAIVSEHRPNRAFSTPGALARNATLSGLSKAVCVIEPAASGGSVRTANAALAQDKPVLIHGSVSERQTERELLRAGARPLSYGDVTAIRTCLREAWDQSADGMDQQGELFA